MQKFLPRRANVSTEGEAFCTKCQVKISRYILLKVGPSLIRVVDQFNFCLIRWNLQPSIFEIEGELEPAIRDS